MKKRSNARRRLSAGTIVMLTITALVLVGFFALLPSFTGNQDIRLDAAKLAVAMDQSLSQIAASTSDYLSKQPQTTALPPESLAGLATAPPKQPGQQQLSPTPVPVQTPEPKRSFTLSAAGSIVWNSNVRKALTFGEEERFDLLTDQLIGRMNADLSFAALENTLIDADKLSNINMPSDLAQPIQQMGVNVLSIAHPENLSSGMDGLSDTMQVIRSAGMHPVGGFTSEDERRTFSMTHLNGVAVCFLSYQETLSSASTKQTSAGERSYAIAPLDKDLITSEITAARQAGAQVIAIHLNWGKKGAAEPSDEQIALAQALADAGADIILGTGSGVLQPVKVLSADRGDGRYHPVLCAYSLGYFFSPDRESRTTLTSILLEATVTYDPASGSVAFEDLGYTPTYAWRGKDEGKTIYRTLLNDNETYPDFVSKDQKGVMERCYKLATDAMADTGIPEKET